MLNMENSPIGLNQRENFYIILLLIFLIPNQVNPAIAAMVPNLPPTPIKVSWKSTNITPTITPTNIISLISGNFSFDTIAAYEEVVATVAKVRPIFGKIYGRAIAEDNVTIAEAITIPLFKLILI